MKIPTMSSKQFERAIDALDLSKADVAVLLGVDASTMRSWLNGRRAIRGPVVRYLKFIVSSGLTGEQALKAVMR